MKVLFLFGQLLLISKLWALPGEVEMWFLSPPKYAKFLQKFNQKQRLKLSKHILAFSEAVHKSCQKMGDQFFHPQVGLHEHMGSVPGVMVNPMLTQDEIDQIENESGNKKDKVKYLSDINTDLVNCDASYYFDLYCGKEKGTKNSGGNELEIWVDTSSSLNQVDRRDRNGDCFRKSFIKRVSSKCGENKIGVSLFDTSLRSMGGEDNLCDGIGLNDQERIIKWIKNSNAKKLLVITDIFELSSKMADFLNSIAAKTRGDIPQKEIVASDLIRFAPDFKKYCQ